MKKEEQIKKEINFLHYIDVKTKEDFFIPLEMGECFEEHYEFPDRLILVKEKENNGNSE